MDSALVEALSSLPPPPSKRGNSIAVSVRGEVAVLSEDRLYVVASPAGDSQGDLVRELDIDSKNLTGVHHIEFIIDYGDPKLLLWGDHRVGIVTFNSRTPQSLKRIPATFTPLLKDYFRNMNPDQHIVHCSYHPESSRHICVLLSLGPLLVVNAHEQTYESFQLDVRCSYSKFSFLRGRGWLRWTVCLLSADGHISYLCPLIPRELRLSKDMLLDLEDWTSDVQNGANRISEISEYVDCCSAFLRSISSNTSTPSGQLYFPQLQGPLHVSNIHGKTIHDIVSLDLDGLDIPIIIAVTEQGEVLSLVFTEEPCPLWTVNNCPPPCPLPEALLIEQVSVRDAIPEGASALPKIISEKSWLLKPDPLVHHAIHVIGQDSCSSFLITLEWLPELMSLELSQHSQTSNFLRTSPSTCVPVFANEGADVTLSGVTIAANPLFGHHALFRSSLGMIAAVNLSVHLKLCSLTLRLSSTKKQIATNDALTEGVPVESLTILTESLLKVVYEGISSTPSPSASASSLDEV